MASADPRPAWWRARAGLIWTLIRTDFKVRYHGTGGGFLWALAKPVTMFVLLMAVFSYVFATDANYKLNLIIGLFLWDVFAEGSKSGLMALQAKGFLITKARCPAWLLVAASLSNALITLVVFTAAIVGYLVWQGHPPTLPGIGLFVVYGVALMAMVLGFALAASVLFLRYQDLNQVWDMAIQAGFFVAPIIYPLGILPERYHALLFLWPPTPVIEFSRVVLVQGTTPSTSAHLLLAGAVGAALVFGTAVHRRLAPRAAEYL